MQAFILAAGRGTRLGSAAEGKPKPLVDISGRPLLSILIEKLVNLGVDQINVNTHHLADQIEYFRDTSPYHDQINLLNEEHLLGTAGTIRSFLKVNPQKELLIMHGDNFFEDDLSSLLTCFRNRESNIVGVVGTFITKDPTTCGIFKIDENSVIHEVYEKREPVYGRIANTAIYIFDQRALDVMADLPMSLGDLSIDVLPRLLGKIVAVPFKGRFIDIGTPENLELARQLAKTNQ